MGYRQAVCRPPTRSNASANAGTKENRQGTALRDGADAARRANRLCNRIRSPAPPLVRRNRDRRTGWGRLARALPAQRCLFRVEASEPAPRQVLRCGTHRAPRRVDRTRPHLPGALRDPRPRICERSRSRRPQRSREGRGRPHGSQRLAERSGGDPSHRTGTTALARSPCAGVNVGWSTSTRRSTP